MSEILAFLLLGARPEPYLPAVLASLDEAIDFLVVNDNSEQQGSYNRRQLEASAMFARGGVGVVEAPFQNFAHARNLCLEYIRRHRMPDRRDPPWLLMVDADEVHGPNLTRLTRSVLPTLSRRVGVADGYFVQFMQSYDYYVALDRRHNLIFRVTDGVRYEREVHEQLVGVQGSRVCLPYIYYHYGYVRSNQHIIDKWAQYARLGDVTKDAQTLPTLDPQSLMQDEVTRCMPYRWEHPPALSVLDDILDAVPDPSAQKFHEAAEKHFSQTGPRLVSLCRRVNYRARILWRLLGAVPATSSPRAWAALLRMAI